MCTYLVEDALGEQLAVLHGHVEPHLAEEDGGEVALEGCPGILDGPGRDIARFKRARP